MYTYCKWYWVIYAKFWTIHYDGLKSLLKHTLIQLIFVKLTGVDKSGTLFAWEGLNLIPATANPNWNETNIKNVISLNFLYTIGKAISVNVEHGDETILIGNIQKSKVFTIVLEIKDWDIILKDNQLENEINKKQKEAKEWLAKTYEEKKLNILKIDQVCQQIVLKKKLLKVIKEIKQYRKWILIQLNQYMIASKEKKQLLKLIERKNIKSILLDYNLIRLKTIKSMILSFLDIQHIL